jgi:hypothetical protein
VRVVVEPADAAPADAAPALAGNERVATGIAPALLRVRLATLLAAQLFDFGTFTVMVARHGAGTEVNPLVAHGLVDYGLPLLGVAKAALVLLLASIVVILGRPGPATRGSAGLATVVALLGVAAGLIGGISNVLVFAR